MSAWHCPHAEHELRTRRISGGGIQYRRQCLNCGRSVGNAISHAEVKVLPPYWDEDLEPMFEARVRAELEAQRTAAEGAELSRREAYRQYLETSAWKARRARVLMRDRYICQGCLSARAVDVHHTTYAHVGSELMFELVSLCRECHDRAHETGSSLEPAEAGDVDA